MRFLLILGVLAGFSAAATTLEFIGEPSKVKVGGNEIAVAPKVKLNTGTQPESELSLSGAGLRKKTILKVKVYWAASYVPNPGLPAEGSPRVLDLTFLRKVSAEQVRDAFLESLKENAVDTTKAPFQKLLEEIKEGISEKGKMTLIGYGPIGAEETLEMWLPSNRVQVTGTNIATDFWKIWFGKPSDSGLASLKDALSSGRIVE